VQPDGSLLETRGKFLGSNEGMGTMFLLNLLGGVG